MKVTGAEVGDGGAWTRGGGRSPGSGASSRRRRRRRPVLEFGSKQVHGSAQSRALSVSFPFGFQTLGGRGGRGEQAGPADARTEKEGPWLCGLPRPQTRQERAGVASASRGGSGGRG